MAEEKQKEQTITEKEKQVIEETSKECLAEIEKVLKKYNRMLFVYGDIRNPAIGLRIQ